jgi:hypothetical protein
MKDYGIDYGRGLSNVDIKTGIRYGVIPLHNVTQTWCDSSDPVYVYRCPKCGNKLKKGIEQKRCGSCRYEIDIDNDFDFDEPISFQYKSEGYKAEQSANDSDIFVIKSEYYTYANLCSPCAPGACYLLDSIDNDPKARKAYCFNHDWFEDGKAPYKVYSVKTGKEVLPN